MAGKSSSNSRGTLQPSLRTYRQGKRNAQTVMIGTEIVETSNDKHTGVQGLRLLGQGSGSASQDIEPLTESGIDPVQ